MVTYIHVNKELPKNAKIASKNGRFLKYFDASGIRYLQFWHDADPKLAEGLKAYIRRRKTQFPINDHMKTFLSGIGFELDNDGKVVEKS